LVFLLDVNVLIALVDVAHVHHDPAHRWFAEEGATAWATCPLTENAVLRIMGGARYPGSPGGPAAVIPSLRSLRALPGHRFWPDDVSLLAGAAVDPRRLLTSDQVTDTYLLALARSKDGRLATFDRRLVTTAVRDGAEALWVIG
jgi:toxin-antitoxin system PIN domain toxin